MAVGLTCKGALVVSYLLWICYTVHSADFSTLDHLRPSSPGDTQADAVTQLVARLLPDRAQDFRVTVDPIIGPPNRDTFQLMTSGSQLSITGTSGVAAVWGLQYYLKQYCGCHISWAGDQLNLPATLPSIAAPGVKVTSNDKFRYYQNVCTVSYSFVWWNWTRWEREIDWMALNGINLPLAFNGQEALWQRVYLKMGFTQQELDAHFGGPAFLAWSRMGNMRGWGGPTPQSWHTQQVALQHQILQRMRDLGMIPVLPAFAGHVPKNITRLFPHVNISRAPDWGNFPEQYCCTVLLDVEDPLFTTIGKAFITEYTNEFGTNHIYNTDTFNELTPKSSNVSYLAAAGKAVFSAMTEADPQAIWLMQGWLFFNDQSFWQPAQAKALLTSVPQGRMIVLDLMAEEFPQYSRLSSFFGQPFIWCMLHNFGGTLPMYGDLQSVNTGPLLARISKNSSMVGTGLTPEGIFQNNVVYEFMNENSWRRKARNISEWMSDYAKRRYGATNTEVDIAWQLLQQSVYNCRDHYMDFNSDVILTSRPELASPLNPDVWYQPELLYLAWDNFIQAADTLSHSALFRYDLVDVTRQSLQVISIKYYIDLITYYKLKDLDGLTTAGTQLLDLLARLDSLLGTDEHFLLGRWLEVAKAWGTTEAEKQLYEFNARNQVTLWGPTGNILDYANKQWSGLIRGYYQPRWQLFFMELQKSLKQGVPFDENKFRQDVFNNVEKTFNTDRSVYPTNPIGDSVQEAKKLHQLFRPMTKSNAHFFAKLPKWSKMGEKFVRYSTRWLHRRQQRMDSKGKDSFKVFHMFNKTPKRNDIV